MRVLSWNIKCDGDYGERLSRIIGEIRLEDVDVICLQEVKYGSYGRIQRELPEYVCVLDRRVEYNRMYGEMILSKYPIEMSKYVGYSKSPNIRGLTLYWVNGIVVGTTHLENGSKYNESNTLEMCSVMDVYDRFILVGDFNYFCKDPLVYDEVRLGSTYLGYSEGDGRADRVYYRGVSVLGMVKRETELSDHCMIVVGFSLKNSVGL